MKYLQAFIIPAFLALAIPASATDKACIISSRDGFIDTTKSIVTRTHSFKGEILKKFVDAVNVVRLRDKLFTVEADEMYVGELSSGKIGIVLFKDGCVVPGSVSSNTTEHFLSFMAEMNSPEIADSLGKDSP